MEIHNPGSPTPEWLCRSTGEKIVPEKATRNHIFMPFELYTCLWEIANLVNQLSVGHFPNDPDDGAYLCPNDTLSGRASLQVPQGPFRETSKTH